MTTAIASILMVMGSLFMLLASLGLVRFPDLYMRMHATTKAATLGTGLLLLAVIFRFGDLDLTARCILTLLFIFLTAPVAAHAIARAAYVSKVPQWQGNLVDEMASESMDN